MSLQEVGRSWSRCRSLHQELVLGDGGWIRGSVAAQEVASQEVGRSLLQELFGTGEE